MSITTSDVNKIAHLARLVINENESMQYANKLSGIFALVTQMNAIDTEAVKPMSHPFNLSQPLREDQVTETNQRDLLLSIAPQAEAGLFIVPKVIEENV